MVVEKLLDFHKKLNLANSGNVILKLISSESIISSFNYRNNTITINIKHYDADFLVWTLCHEYKHYLQFRDRHFSMRERHDILQFSILFYTIIIPAIAVCLMVLSSLFISLNLAAFGLLVFLIFYFIILISQTRNISSFSLFQNNLKKHSHILEYEADEFATIMTNYIPLFLDAEFHRLRHQETVTHPSISDRLYKMKKLIILGSH